MFPIWLTNVMSILFGLIVGSFLNVVIVRLPLNESVVTPRSRCPKCNSAIAWWDNIPVLSYLILGGKCRKCKVHIPLRYPVVEVMTAVLFLATRIRYGWEPLLFIRDWPFVASLVAITFIDLEHRIIPDPLSLGGLVLGLITSPFTPEVGWKSGLIGAAVGFGIFYALAWGYEKMSGKAGLGGGDIKLLAMLGAFLGPSGVFTAVLVSSIVGSLTGVAWAFFSGKKNLMKVAIPYGPFLVIGGLYYYLLDGNLWPQFTIPM